MTVFIGPTFRCPPAVADHVGLREGQRVAHLTANQRNELQVLAAAMGLPDRRFMGGQTPRWRYIITAAERYRARAQGAEEATVGELDQLVAHRARPPAR